MPGNTRKQRVANSSLTYCVSYLFDAAMYVRIDTKIHSKMNSLFLSKHARLCILLFMALGAQSCDIFGDGHNSYTPPALESSPATGVRTLPKYYCKWENAAHVVEILQGNLNLDINGTGNSTFNHWTMYTSGHHAWQTIHTTNNTPILNNVGNRINNDYVYFQVPSAGPWKAIFQLFPKGYPDCEFPSCTMQGKKYYLGYRKTVNYAPLAAPYPTNSNDDVLVGDEFWFPVQ